MQYMQFLLEKSNFFNYSKICFAFSYITLSSKVASALPEKNTPP